MGGSGINVKFKCKPDLDSPFPFQIHLQAECPTVAVVMIDKKFTDNDEYVESLEVLSEQIEEHGNGSRLLPVAVESGVLDNIALDQQILRSDLWDLEGEAYMQRLIRELAHEFSRVLRHYLNLLLNPDIDQMGIEQDLEKIQIFLSHTKHDGKGKDIAEKIRGWIHQNSNLSSFMDVHDIPSGLPFSDVIEKHISKSVFLAIHTDHYSSREWCRREVIEAKRKGVPMIVADCLQIGDEKAFPYLGNVPIVRMDPIARNCIEVIIGRLVDEVLANFLWSCRVEKIPERPENIMFLPRSPELLSLVTLETKQERPNVIVYPDPPLGMEEMDLFSSILRDGLQIRSMSQWLTKEDI